jgi:hypothetical protein
MALKKQYHYSEIVNMVPMKTSQAEANNIIFKSEIIVSNYKTV